jgi:ABC-2 type transport system permease protein
MTAAVMLFEVGQRLRRMSAYIYFTVVFLMGFLFVVTTGGALGLGPSGAFGSSGRVLINSPFILNQVMGSISLICVSITSALAGQATYQDIENNCTPFIFTSGISKFEYLVGRFLGALILQFIILTAIGIGVWVGMHMPGFDTAQIGPQRFAAYFRPYLILILPNLVFTTAVFFSVATLSRKMLPVYAGSILFLAGYLVALQLSSDTSHVLIASMADPFGLNACDFLTRYWSPIERNTQLIPFTGVLLLNRIVWVGMGIAILAFTYFKFSMSQLFALPRTKSSALSATPRTGYKADSLPVIHSVFSFNASIRQLLSMAHFQFLQTVENVFFAVIVLAGVVFVLITLFAEKGFWSTPIYPVTYSMTESVTASFTLFVLAINTFYAGELVWRERDSRFHQIVDAMPVRRWVFFGSKLLALMLIQVVLVFVLFFVGLFVQVAEGYYHFELSLYFRELFLNQLPMYWVLCIVALWIHIVVNNKYLGHFVVILYYLLIWAMPALGWGHGLFLFGKLPGYLYSDMNGYGPFAAPLIWFHLYWILGATILVLFANILVVRGVEIEWRERIQLARRLYPASRTGLLICVGLFVGVGSYIFYNTNILNNYHTKYETEHQRVQYETLFRRYKDLPQASATDITANVDLEPDRRIVSIRGTMWLENKTAKQIDRIAVTTWPGLLEPLPRFKGMTVNELAVASGQDTEIENPGLGFHLYRLRTPMVPHSRLLFKFSIRYTLVGFPNDAPNTDIVDNGSFIDDSYLPTIGYNDRIELHDDNIRLRHGLKAANGLPTLENAIAHPGDHPLDDGRVNLDMTVSTELDQTAIVPGRLVKEWMENGHRYFHYKTDAPILNEFSINSARYQVRRDHWKDVNLELYYHRGHEFNLDSMLSSMKATLQYCSETFSPYQFHQLRIVEFPRYQEFSISLPGTIPVSEGVDFITHVDSKRKDSFDLPFYATSKQIGLQWWGDQVVPAPVEGASAVTEPLAEYTALMVMKHYYGPEMLKSFLRQELDRYLSSRAGERNRENPLMRVQDGQFYIDHSKASLVMYALQDYIGEDQVNIALASFLKAYSVPGAHPTSLDLVSYLRKATPPDLQYLLDDMFVNITLYDNRAVSATSTQSADGKYQVHLTVESKKYHADGRGQEQQIPVHDWIDIGVLDANGHYLYLKKQKIEHEMSSLDLVVDKEPAQAGIDPTHKLIDRQPEDNAIRVKMN